MMAHERFKSARDNFGKLIHQFQPETKTLIRKLERTLIKFYRQNVSSLFNQTCLNERLLPNYTHTHTNARARTNTHIYIYGKMVDCGESDKMIKMSGIMDKKILTKSLEAIFHSLFREFH